MADELTSLYDDPQTPQQPRSVDTTPAPNSDLDSLYSDIPSVAPQRTATSPKPRNRDQHLQAIRAINPEFADTAQRFIDFANGKGLTDVDIRSGYRTAAEQNYLDTHGYPTKGNDGYANISPHQQGRAIDWTTRNPANKQRLHDLMQIFVDKEFQRGNKLHIPNDEPWHMAGQRSRNAPDPGLNDLYADSATTTLSLEQPSPEVAISPAITSPPPQPATQASASPAPQFDPGNGHFYFDDPRTKERVYQNSIDESYQELAKRGLNAPRVPGRALTGYDFAWHGGIDPDEMRNWPKALRDKASAVIAREARQDELKKAAGQPIERPPLSYQNDIRKRIGLEPISQPSARAQLLIDTAQSGIPKDAQGRLLDVRPGMRSADLSSFGMEQRGGFTVPKETDVQRMLRTPVTDYDKSELARQQQARLQQAQHYGFNSNADYEQWIDKMSQGYGGANLRQSAEQEIAIRAGLLKQSQMTGQDAEDIRNQTHQLSSSLLSSLFDRSATTAASIVPGIWQVMGDLTDSESVKQLAVEGRKEINKRLIANRMAQGERGVVGRSTVGLSNLAGDVLVIAGLSRVVGPTKAMSLYSGLSTLGQTGDYSEAGREGFKGALYGELFKTLPHIEPTQARTLTEKLVNLGVDAGSVATGTYAMERASGKNHDDALQSALTNSLLAGTFRLTDIIPAIPKAAAEKVLSSDSAPGWARRAAEWWTNYQQQAGTGAGTKGFDAAPRVEAAIRDIRQRGASPEAKAFFAGIEPRLAGTTISKVKQFADDLGIPWEPDPRWAAAESGQPTAPTSAPPEPATTAGEKIQREFDDLYPPSERTAPASVPQQPAGTTLPTEAAQPPTVRETTASTPDQIGNAVDVGGNWKTLRDLPDDSRIALYHATSREKAEAIMREGYNAKQSGYTNTPADYVYMGSKSGLGTYEGQQGGTNPAYVVFGVRKGALEADAGSDWKSYLKNPRDRASVHSLTGGNPRYPTAVDTFAHINQVRAPKGEVEPLGIYDPKTQQFTPRSEFLASPQPATDAIAPVAESGDSSDRRAGVAAASGTRVSPDEAAGSQPIPTPEKPETIREQLDALYAGRRRAVLIPPGAPYYPPRSGYGVVRTPVGRFIYKKGELVGAGIQQAVHDNTYHELLGIVEPKSAETTRIVTARTPEGVEAQSAVVSPEREPEQVAQFEKQYPESAIETGGADQMQRVVDERTTPLLTFDKQEIEGGHGADDYESDEGDAYTITAKDKTGNPVGRVDVNVTGDTVHVRWIETAPAVRRQGLASALMDEVERMWPAHEIETSGFTEAGSAFWNRNGRQPDSEARAARTKAADSLASDTREKLSLRSSAETTPRDQLPAASRTSAVELASSSTTNTRPSSDLESRTIGTTSSESIRPEAAQVPAENINPELDELYDAEPLSTEGQQRIVEENGEPGRQKAEGSRQQAATTAEVGVVGSGSAEGVGDLGEAARLPDQGRSDRVPEGAGGAGPDALRESGQRAEDGTGSSGGDRQERVPESRPAGLSLEQQTVKASRNQPRNALLERDYRIQPDKLDFGGKKEKFRLNIAAIQTLKQIEAEGRSYATAEEQEKLVRYVGWGGLPEVFNRWQTDAKWKKEHDQIVRLLGGYDSEEYGRAMDSTKNAHFTSPEVVGAIWQMVERLGFEGGRTLEPALGTGNLFGMMPPEIHGNPATTMKGIELDPLTGRIAQLLYPSASVNIQSFQDYDIADNYYDLVTSNVPFSETTQIVDKRYAHLRTMLHDYFFVKSLDKVRPGGLIAFITSTGTMDRQRSDIRKAIAEKADLVAAFRLPDTAFKKNAGTEVTTDFLILRKRTDTAERIRGLRELVMKAGAEKIAAQAKGQHDEGSGMMIYPDEFYQAESREARYRADLKAAEAVSAFADNKWVETKTMKLGGRNLQVNEYYHEHPDNMLGTPTASIKMYGPGESGENARFALRGTDDFPERLEKAIESLPQGVYRPFTGDRSEEIRFPAPEEIKQGAWLVRDGKLFRKHSGELVQQDSTADRIARVEAMIPVRQAIRELFLTELGKTKAEVSVSRERLNEAYDAFIAKHGPLNSKANIKAFAGDPDGPMLLKLERPTKDGKYNKADIFRKSVVKTYDKPSKADSVNDAVGISLNETARLDLNRMGELLSKTPDQIEEELIAADLGYRDPLDGWVVKDEYLSGNLKKKLMMATEAAKTDDLYKRNVEALTQAIKEKLPDVDYVDIDARVGANWIPADDLKQFAAELMQISPKNFQIHYLPSSGTWVADSDHGATYHGPQATNVWGTSRAPFMRILQAALDNKNIAIYDKSGDASVLNKDATEAANAKVKEVKEQFKGWVWQDDDRRTRLHRYYNDNFNNIVNRTFDGQHLTLPGLSPEWQAKLRPHVKDAVWRVISTGKMLGGHEVGTGKTAVMVISSMELKRLGLARKSMIAGLNSTISGLAKEAREMYPNINMLVLGEKDIDAKQRNLLMADIASSDYDLTIMGHSHVDMLPVLPETQAKYIHEEMNELEAALTEIEGDANEGGPANESNADRAKRRKKSGNAIVKQLAKAKEKLEEKLKAALASKRDNVVYFEQTGIDNLAVDEAHKYKAVPVHTKRGSVKGIPTSRSDRATNMLMLTRWLQEQNRNRGVSLYSGTLISNALTEVYTLQRFVQWTELKERGIEAFDAWANLFGETTTKLEYTTTGEYKQVTRFNHFTNLPELRRLLGQVMDIRFASDLPGFKRPERKDEVVSVPMSDAQWDYLVNEIRPRAEAVKKSGGRAEKGQDNMLSISTDARKSAMDMRLVRPTAYDDPGSKVNEAIAKILRNYQEHPGKTQMLFSDYGINPTPWGFSLTQDIIKKLVKGGIPRDEIINFNELSRAQRGPAIRALDAAKARIGIGSTEKMGTGINAQTHLRDLLHIDAPWLPAYVEQRNGRGWRPGNENETVNINTFTTAKSFDTFMWQTVANKQRFIDQFMRGDESLRSIRDDDTDELSFSQIMAVTSGNPELLFKMQLEDEVNELNRASRRHENQQLQLKDTIKWRERNIETERKAIKEYTADAATYEQHKDEPFSITIGDKSFKVAEKAKPEEIAQVKAKAGKYLKQRADAIYVEYKDAGRYRREELEREGESLGSYRGFTVQFKPNTGNLYLAGERDYSISWGEDELTALRSMDAVLRQQPQNRVKGAESSIAQYEREAVQAEAQLGKPFRDTEKLTKKREELTAVTARLEASTPEVQEAAAADEAETNTAMASDAEAGGEISSERQIDTPEFRRWFGDSKVVDANGSPLIVYHGTAEPWEVYDDSRLNARQQVERRDAERAGAAIYLTSSKPHAELYGTAMPLYANIENPHIYDAEEEAYQFWQEEDPQGEVDFKKFVESRGGAYGVIGSADEIFWDRIGSAKAHGNDGVIVDFGALPLSEGGEPAGKVYIVFSPTQIKSATGNVGKSTAKASDNRRPTTPKKATQPAGKKTFGPGASTGGELSRPSIGDMIDPSLRAPMAQQTKGASEQSPTVSLLTALTQSIRKAAGAATTHGAIAASTLATGDVMNQLRGWLHTLAGHSMPKTTLRDRLTGELGARYAASRAAAGPMADLFANDVLTGIDIDQAKFDALLKADNLLSIKDDFEKAGETENADKVNTLFGEPDFPFATEDDMVEYGQTPEVQEALARHIENWDAVIDPMYREAAGIDPDLELPTRGKHFGARINLNPIVEGVYEPDNGTVVGPKHAGGLGGYLLGTLQRRTPFARKAYGTGQRYLLNYAETIGNTFWKQLEIANKRAFDDALVNSGNAEVHQAGKRVVLSDGEPTKAYPYRRKGMTIPGQEEGSTQGITQQHNIYVRESLAKEYAHAADIILDPYRGNMLVSFNKLMAKIALTGLTDATVHISNLSTVLMQVPGTTGLPLLPEALLSALGRLDIPITAVRTLIKAWPEMMTRTITPSLLKNMTQMASLTEINAGRPKHENRQLIGKRLGIALQGMDRVTRMVMDDSYRNLNQQGLIKDNETQRREFINQVGSYNLRTQGEWMRFLRQTWTSPFATAGRTFATLGIRGVTLNPGVEASSVAAAAAMRGAMAAKWIGTLVLVGLLNYLINRKLMGRPGTPIGAIDTGMNDKNGNPLYINVMNLTGQTRALRTVGARGAIQAWRRGLPASDVAGAAARDITNTAAGPIFGPGLRFAFEAASGYQPAVGVPRQSETVAPSESQTLENLRSAAMQANPLLASVEEYRKPGGSIAKALERQLPRFTLTPVTPAQAGENYPELVQRAQAREFTDWIVHSARAVPMADRKRWVDEQVNRLPETLQGEAQKEVMSRGVFAVRSPTTNRFYTMLIDAEKKHDNARIYPTKYTETDDERAARMQLQDANKAIHDLEKDAVDAETPAKRQQLYTQIDEIAERALSGEAVKRVRPVNPDRQQMQQERQKSRRLERWLP